MYQKEFVTRDVLATVIRRRLRLDDECRRVHAKSYWNRRFPRNITLSLKALWQTLFPASAQVDSAARERHDCTRVQPTTLYCGASFDAGTVTGTPLMVRT